MEEKRKVNENEREDQTKGETERDKLQPSPLHLTGSFPIRILVV